MSKYLWFDTETGGLDPKKHSLLTAFFAVCDENHNVLDELYIQMRPENPDLLSLTEGAMKVNKIDMSAHLQDPNTLSYSEASLKLKTFLQKNKPKGKDRLIPCGHNVFFDKDFIWEQLMPKAQFEEAVHYRTLDTSSICAFFKDVGLFPDDLGQLLSLVEYFKLPIGEAHNARGDVLMNIEVYKAIKAMMKSKRSEISGSSVSSSSLLKIIED